MIYIAKENKATIKIKVDDSINRICVELECEVFDFNTSALKKFISSVTYVSKFTTIESKTNGKACLIFEFEILYESFWYEKRTDDLLSAWQSQGFEITNVDFCSREVNFHKEIKKSSRLIIPKIFLTDKIPNDAKYEPERFFEYIRKKYGI